MIPVWVIALLAALGAVCLALPLHIGMTGVCLLLLAAVLLALAVAAFFLRKRLGDKGRRALICASLAASLLYFTGYQHWVQQPVLLSMVKTAPWICLFRSEDWKRGASSPRNMATLCSHRTPRTESKPPVMPTSGM